MLTALVLKSSLSFSLSLVGGWWFDKIYYQGEVRPIPNPDLVLCVEYKEDGESHLLWYRKNLPGFCERWGKYSYDGETLRDEVLRVNDKNAAECSSDMDMQVGRKSETPAVLKDGMLNLSLSLGDEPLIYIWKSVQMCPEPPMAR
jgi:hypothetical protein